MFLGTSRRWWLASGLLVALGVVLVVVGVGGALGTAGGVLLLVLGMIVYTAAPMRYGRRARPPRSASPPPPPPPAAAAPRPRAEIEAGDPSEV